MAYTDKQKESIFDHVFTEIINGRALRTILKEDEGMPDIVTIYKWLDEDEEKVKRYMRAREAQADKIFEEILEIADNTKEGVVLKETENGIERTYSDMIHHRRLQVDSRKWMASKLAPKKYGDNKTVDLNVKQEQPLFPDAQ
jgi:hypothetical protein